MIVTVAFSVFLLANLVSPIEALIDQYFPYLSAYRTVAAALLFLVMTLLLYQALHRLLDSIFIKDEQIQAGHAQALQRYRFAEPGAAEHSARARSGRDGYAAGKRGVCVYLQPPGETVCNRRAPQVRWRAGP